MSRPNRQPGCARFAGLLMTGLLLVGCGPRTDVPPAPSRVPQFPAATQPSPAQRAVRLYRIDPSRSQVRIYTYRGGRLAHLGHNHILASAAVQGQVLFAQPLEAARFDLVLPLASLVVDDPARRAAAGPEFASTPSAADIAATRRNMLGAQVLDVDRYPEVRVRGRPLAGSLAQLSLEASISLHGVERRQVVVADVVADADGLRARGQFFIRQSDYGITPFAALGGLLSVVDRLRIDFDLQATADTAGSAFGTGTSIPEP